MGLFPGEIEANAADYGFRKMLEYQSKWTREQEEILRFQGMGFPDADLRGLWIDAANEARKERSLQDWAYVNCVTAYYDIHGLWIAANTDGSMLGHGETKLEALEKAQADRYARHEHSEDVRRFAAACFMNGGNQ